MLLLLVFFDSVRLVVDFWGLTHLYLSHFYCNYLLFIHFIK